MNLVPSAYCMVGHIKRIALLFGAAIAIPSIASENCESRLETKINSSFTETTDDVILAE